MLLERIAMKNAYIKIWESWNMTDTSITLYEVKSWTILLSLLKCVINKKAMICSQVGNELLYLYKLCFYNINILWILVSRNSIVIFVSKELLVTLFETYFVLGTGQNVLHDLSSGIFNSLRKILQQMRTFCVREI